MVTGLERNGCRQQPKPGVADLAVLGLSALPSLKRTKAHLSCSLRIRASTPDVGAGGARSRAMSTRILLNICRDTATSAS
jgi:hypothetical protein